MTALHKVESARETGGANTAEMLCCDSPPKCRAFVIICCYMLSQHNTATTSLKGLVRCKTAVKALIDETLSLSVAFDVFRTARQMLQIASRVAEREMNVIRPAGFRKASNE